MPQDRAHFNSLLWLVDRRADDTPHADAFTFVDFPGRSGSRAEKRMDVATLRRRAMALAASIAATSQPGDRALLAFRPGLEFAVAFLACLRAGVVAVPVPMPRPGLAAERVRAVIEDANPSLVLTTSNARTAVEAVAGDGHGCTIIDADTCGELEGRLIEGSDLSPDTLAVLQYSSGSTGSPKGVMISHGNLVHQGRLIFDLVQGRPGDTWAAWLPMYHDMGLISAVVTPLVAGLHSVLMSPDAFVLRPARWLRLLSDYKVTCCASPNFAWDLCTRKIADDDLQGIDLSQLQVGVSGAEPVRAATIERFVERFGRYGFGANVIYPAFGLAEATLLVTGRRDRIVRTSFAPDALAQGRAEAAVNDGVVLVSSGVPQGGSDVRIVDPETRVEQAAGTLGEIWVAGPSVGQGYWQGGKISREGFDATLASETASATYLRTGDMGFLHDGELYVQGRLKDLLIAHGAKHHAVDIEQTVETLVPGAALARTAAFANETEDGEHLVVVHEIDKARVREGDIDVAAMARQIQEAVAERHGLHAHEVLVIASGLPLTSSGKIRRAECRRRYMAGELKVLASYSASAHRDAAEPTLEPGDEASVLKWLSHRLRSLTGEPCGASSGTEALVRDAEAMASLVQDIKLSFGLVVPFTIFTDFPTYGELAGYLAASAETERAAAPAEGGMLRADELAQAESKTGTPADEPLAIVGMACRFPGADNPREFWRNLCDGLDTVTDVPAHRWDAEALYDPNPLAIGKMNTRRGGFLSDVESFDARFFGIQTREAVRMDPAHRLLLELSWEAFEDAGMLPASAAGAQVGVFVGISGSDYAQLQFGDDALSDPYAGVGCALTNAASRISHFHDFRGPAMAVDTACSSSLSAMHLGAQALRTGECEMVLVGGVNVILAPTVTMSLSKAGMMAPDGRCKTFDASADGYVRSEGAGLLLLKPLSKAQADGDPIYAVIRSSASNQDGHGSAISAPNGQAQQRVVLDACERAGVTPADLDYVEAHGTGTSLGDPIEVNALGELIKAYAKPGHESRIGSVKTNIGHCESAAGSASLIKAAMVLSDKRVPPSLNFVEPNPLIAFNQYSIAVQRELGPLPERDRPRLAGVNSFGIGGTNVHVVLEEFTAADAAAPDAPASLQIVPVSGKNERALKANARALSEWLRAEGAGFALADIAMTLGAHRTAFDQALAVSGPDHIAIADAIDAWLETGHNANVVAGSRQVHGNETGVVFVFAGQGSQWWGMGRELYHAQPAYREALHRYDAGIARFTGWSVVDVLLADEADSLLGDTAYAQPTLFAFQCAMVALLDAMGVKPGALVGHSFGEVAAAHVAGSLSFDAACQLIALRARAMSDVRGKGYMVSVELPRDAVLAELASRTPALSVAASNSPTTTVVSGEREALDALVHDLRSRDIAVIDLKLDYAFHSSLTLAAAERLRDELPDAEAIVPSMPLMSTVHADWVTPERLQDKHYWAANIRNEVRFREAIAALAASGRRVFLEIGANSVLSGAMTRTLNAEGIKGTAVPVLTRDVPDHTALWRAVAAITVAGAGIEWKRLASGGRFVRGLPHYRWERQRYWLDAPHQEARTRIGTHPLVTIRMPVAQPTWQSRLDGTAHPYLRSVRMRGKGRLTNGLYVELALEAASHGGSRRRELTALRFDDVLPAIEDSALPLLQSTLQAHDSAHTDAIHVTAQTDDSQGRAHSWRTVLACRSPMDAGDIWRRPSDMDPSTLLPSPNNDLSGSDAYRKLGEIGVEFVHAAQGATRVRTGEGRALLDLAIADRLRMDAGRYHLHPLVFEAMEQAVRMAVGGEFAHATLAGLRRLRVFGLAVDAAYAYASVTGSADSASVTANVWILDNDGGVVAMAEAMSLVRQQAGGNDDGIDDDPDTWRYVVDWQRCELAADQPVPASRWLVLGDNGGTGAVLVDELRRRGHEAALVLRDDAPPANDAPGVTRVSSMDPAAMERLFRDTLGDGRAPVHAVVHLWHLDDTDCPQETGVLGAGYLEPLNGFVDTIRGVTLADPARAPRLWLVTRGAQRVVAGDGPVHLAQALAWGCAKSVVHEHAELRCARMDLSAMGTPDVSALANELLADTLDDQVALRDDGRYVARLERSHPKGRPDTLGNGEAFEVRLADTGSIREPVRRRGPAVGEIEIRVQAANVRWVNGELRTDAVCGTVVRVAPGASLAVGDRVVSLAQGPLGSYRRIAATQAVPVQDMTTLSDALAASRTVPALLALRDLARVTRGEHVLVRSIGDRTAEDVVRVARWLGARVSAVAPRSAHAVLEHAGATRVFDESDPVATDLAVSTLRGTGGVDLLINLAPHLGDSPCMGMLRSGGRCVEYLPMDTAGTPPPSGIPANAAYLAVDLARYVEDRPAQALALLQDALSAPSLARGSTDGMFAIDDLADAVADAPAAVHGVQLDDAPETASDMATWRGDATYMITGGLGGLGLMLARRMVRDGARHLVLAGRSAPSLVAMDTLAELQAYGAECHVLALDIADTAAVDAAMNDMAATMPPLRGIVHAAGVLDNGLLVHMSHEQIARVMRAKVQGALNLHHATRRMELDFFVMFSSLASCIGSPGQANYAAANAALDALAEDRRRVGLPGLAIAWGPWSDAGMAADVHNLQRLAQHGMGMVSPEHGLDLLEDVVREGQGGAMGALPMNWPNWARTRGYAAQTTYFASLVGKVAGGPGNNGRITARSLTGMDKATRIDLLANAVRRAVCQALLLEVDQVDMDTPLTALGLDSIVSLELKDRIESAIDVTVRTNALVAGKSIRVLATQFADDFEQAAGETGIATSRPDGDVEAVIDQMSDEEIEAMLRDLESDSNDVSALPA